MLAVAMPNVMLRAVRGVARQSSRIWPKATDSWTSVKVYARWRLRRPRNSHSLGQELVVSLTSYPARFGTLALTLRSLLTQSVRPDRVVLWLGRGDRPKLPRNVLQLQRFGLEIRATKDIGSYTKIVPALEAFPCAIIVTADDDVYYRRRWLAELLQGWDGRKDLIVCHRAHRLRFDAAGCLLPYRQWDFDAMSQYESADLLPTGVGGVLYPPGSLSPEVLEEHTFLTLCPRADDLWLYWMGRRAGALYKTVGRRRSLVYWPGTQDSGLYHHNLLSDGNDLQIASLLEKYGLPRAAYGD